MLKSKQWLELILKNSQSHQGSIKTFFFNYTFFCLGIEELFMKFNAVTLDNSLIQCTLSKKPENFSDLKILKKPKNQW